MKKQIFLTLTCIVFCTLCLISCGKVEPSPDTIEIPVDVVTINKLNLTSFNIADLEEASVKIKKVPTTTFELDYNYLAEHNYPEQVIETIKAQNTKPQTLSTSTNDKTYYFVYDDVMLQSGTNQFRIISVDKNGISQELFKSDYKNVDVISTVYFNDRLFWSEQEYGTEKVVWSLKSITDSGEVQIVTDSEKLPSTIAPVLSVNEKGIYWYTTTESNDSNKANIYCYTTEIKVVANNVLLNSPYSRVPVYAEKFAYAAKNTENNSVVIKDSDGKSFDTEIDSALIGVMDINEKYIICEELIEAYNYTKSKLIILNRETNQKYAINTDLNDINFLGAGVVGEYIYINFKEDFANIPAGLALLDIQNSIVYTNSASSNQWIFKNQNGELIFENNDDIFNIQP